MIHSTLPDGTPSPELLHQETGMIMNNEVPGTAGGMGSPSDWQVLRMATIPHGNVLSSLGSVTELDVSGNFGDPEGKCSDWNADGDPMCGEILDLTGGGVLGRL